MTMVVRVRANASAGQRHMQQDKGYIELWTVKWRKTNKTNVKEQPSNRASSIEWVKSNRINRIRVYPLLFIPHIEQNKGLICTTD